jgi:PAS domain S-box-containing protein
MDYHKIFLPPVYDSLERSQKAVFLHYTLILSTVALLVFGYLNLTWGAMTLGWMLLAISGLCIVGVVLNKTKHFYLAAIGFTVIIFIAIFYNLIDGATLHDPGIAALPIFLILVSILFSRSFIPHFTLASILGIFAVYYFWKTGLLVLSQAPTLNRVIVLTILQVVTGFLSWMIVSAQSKTTSALDLSEERFRSLFMAAPIGIGVTTQDGKVLVYNESLIKIGGWTPDEFKLINVQDHYLNPENRIKIMNILEAAGVVRGYETKLLRQDNSVIDVNMSIIPIRYGAEDALLTILENISERKQTELERQEELDFRKLLVDSSPIFFTVVNEQGETTMMNKSMLGALGYEWEQIRKADYINTFVPERERSSVLKVIEEVFQKNKTRVSENHLLTKTGQELLVEWHTCPIINPEGKNDFIFAYGVDITERKKAEQSLRQSAERDRVFFEESPLLNWHFDLDPPMPLDLTIDEQIDWIIYKTCLVDTNMNIAQNRLEQDDVELILGSNLLANWGGEEIYGRDTIKEFIKGGYTLKMYETPEYSFKGELTWSIINGFGTIEDNHLVRILGTTMDIYDRKMAEDELRESEEKFQKVFMKSPYFMTIARLEDGVYVDVNEAFEKKLGYSREEFIGRSAMDLGVLKDPNTIEKMNRIIAKEGWSKDLELVFIHKDGQEVISLVSSEIIELNGEPHRVSIGKDITDLKESERSLVESEVRYRTLFEHAAEGISIHAGDRFIDVNETWQKMFGRTKAEVIGHTPFDYSPEKQPDGLDSEVKGWELIKKAQGGIEQKFDWRHLRSDGTEFDAEIFMTVINISGEEVMISFVRDLTERKRADAAAQEERQRLARDLHDAVSQTLWSASLIADVLPDVWEQDPEKGRERLGRLRQLTRGALAEMRALLLELRPSALIETKMAELLKRLVEATTSRSGAQISLAHEGECDLPEDVHVAFYRVVQEALNNATQHAMASEIKIRLHCGPKNARLEIQDNGRGFDPEDTTPGQHLGLKIMRERASSIEARLDIISRSGEGTQVILIWPDDGEVNDD